MIEWLELENAMAVAEHCCKEIQQQARAAIAAKGSFKLVLAGGTTPALAYSLLAQSECNFTGWEFYIGDERCLPANHPERNSLLATQTLLDPAGISADQLFPISAELGAEQAATLYEQTVAAALPFDCVLLGLGEDGHTASLFPGHHHPQDRLVVPVHDAPKPPPDRVSLTTQCIRQSTLVLFLVTGAAKRPAVREWRNTGTIPAADIDSDGQIKVLIDQAANQTD